MDHNLNLSSQLVEFTVEGLSQGSNIASESMTEKKHQLCGGREMGIWEHKMSSKLPTIRLHLLVSTTS